MRISRNETERDFAKAVEERAPAHVLLNLAHKARSSYHNASFAAAQAGEVHSFPRPARLFESFYKHPNVEQYRAIMEASLLRAAGVAWTNGDVRVSKGGRVAYVKFDPSVEVMGLRSLTRYLPFDAGAPEA